MTDDRSDAKAILDELVQIRQLLLLLVVGLGALVAAGLVLTVVATLAS